MRRFVYQLADRLSDPDSGLSRNRHFSLFSTPAGARALRLHRRLSSLSAELSRHRSSAQLTVEPLDGEVELRLEIPSIKLVRTSRLSPDDIRVLLRHQGPLPDALRPLLREHPELAPLAGPSRQRDLDS